MVGDIASDMYLRTVVGMGSRSQDELDDWDKKLVISSNVAGVKEERIGGGEVVAALLILILICHFEFDSLSKSASTQVLLLYVNALESAKYVSSTHFLLFAMTS